MLQVTVAPTPVQLGPLNTWSCCHLKWTKLPEQLWQVFSCVWRVTAAPWKFWNVLTPLYSGFVILLLGVAPSQLVARSLKGISPGACMCKGLGRSQGAAHPPRMFQSWQEVALTLQTQENTGHSYSPCTVPDQAQAAHHHFECRVVPDLLK